MNINGSNLAGPMGSDGKNAPGVRAHVPKRVYQTGEHVHTESSYRCKHFTCFFSHNKPVFVNLSQSLISLPWR